MGSEFWAAIAGAIVGGAITGLFQYITLWHEAARENKRERDMSAALGRSLLFKLMRIASDLQNIRKHLNGPKGQMAGDHEQEAWSHVLPVANLPNPQKIDPDEVAVVMGERASIANDLLDLEGIHASSISLMKMYGEIRGDLTRAISPAGFRGNVGSASLSADEMLKLRPMMIEANSIIEQMSAKAESDVGLAISTVKEVNSILQKYGVRLQLKFDA